MFARNAPRMTRLRPRLPARCLPQRRAFNSSSSPAQFPQSTAPLAPLAPFVTELDRLAPSFDVRGSDIRIIKTPAEFYQTLKGKIRSAERRVFLATLYIGKSEQELIDTLRDALRRNPKLTVSILTDCLRGTREAPNPSSASLLAPLVEEFGQRVEIRMYHTPNLTGLRKKHVPRRINEGWGLQHMKLYGVDDEIILSGANLSTDYFTNRQDRYHLFTSKEVTEYFHRIHDAVASLSYLVKPSSSDPSGFTLSWSAPSPSPLDSPTEFTRHATSVLNPLITPTTLPTSDLNDTRVYILSQMSQLLKPDTSTELPALTHVLRVLARPEYASSSWTFTAGYFNPAPSLTQLLLSTARGGSSSVITASQQANGFYGSKGVSGMLPPAYTVLLRRFLDAAHRAGRADISAMEWRRGTVGEKDGWTYHAKGLWVTLPKENAPCMTIVGSSNYTKRSYSLDLEAGALIVTRDEGLKGRLEEEKKGLGGFAQRVTRDDFTNVERRVGFHVRVAMWIVKMVGGAL